MAKTPTPEREIPIPIPGWFPQENRDQLARLIVEHDIRSVVEIGSFMGLSAVWFASHPQIESVTCVDLFVELAPWRNGNTLVETLDTWGWPRDFFHLFRDNVARSGYWHKIHPIKQNSRFAGNMVPPADLVYIDGDHTKGGCKQDIEIYLPKAKKTLCGDDYQEHPDFGVIQAVDELLPHRQVAGQFWWVETGV
jgi:hypothetical protein